ncbi:MAG: retropepsin-like aspartic protease [Isosphaeraceae bacterium]|nr:retropepsin-like aspartic protease [Isosphaeraceae bacterium]
MTRRSIVALFGLTVLALTHMASAADDKTAEALLKERGLRRSGTTYIIALEAQLQKRLDAAKDGFKKLTFAQRQQKMFEQGAIDSKAMMRELTQQRMLLNRQLALTNTTEDHNRVVAMLNEVTDQLSLLNQEANDPEARKKVAAQVAEQREAFMQSVLDARQVADEATAAYAKLAEDAEVRDALAALNQKTKAKLTLGPTKTFLANIKVLEKVEASVLSEDVTLRDGGGVFLVDVTFNGKVTKEMILDTGASIVSITSELAQQIGLKPTKETPTIKVQIADGSVVEAKLMTIPSIRVGKFTIQNVQCSVAPADRQDSPLLLGGSFLKHFVYHVKPDAGKLILTKVDTPDDSSAPAPRGKAASKSSRRATGKAAAGTDEPRAPDANR